jgi:hypothetical protein
MRRNGYNSTSDLNSGIAIGSAMPENIYVSKISSKKHKLAPFCEFVTNLPYSPHCEKTAHARQTGSCFPICTIINSVNDSAVLNHCADFGDDRLIIADARAQCLLRMRRNGPNTTSGLKSDFTVGFPVPENLYRREILAKNSI